MKQNLTNVAGFFFDHAYLVYKDDSANEFVIHGGYSGTVTYPGNISLQINILLSVSEDARVDSNNNPLTPEDRYSRELDLDGRNAEDVWQVMSSHAQNILDENLPYIIDLPILGTNQNSNSVVASVLYAVGIDPFFNLPISHGTSTLPGITNFLTFDRNLTGTSNNDNRNSSGGAEWS